MQEANNLKNNNPQKLLLPHQMLPNCGLVTSATKLIQSVAQNPKNIDKAITAAIKMNRFYTLNHKMLNNPNLAAEKLSIPAMLSVLTDNAALFSQSSELLGKSRLIVLTAENSFIDRPDSPMEKAYSQYKQTFSQLYKDFTKLKSRPGNRAMSLSQKHTSPDNKPVYEI